MKNNMPVENKLVEFFIRTGEIDQTKAEIYQYGFKLLVKKIVHIMIIMSIGFICNELFGMLMFLVAYMMVREYAGGYHANSGAKCLLCTVIVSVIAVGMMKGLTHISMFYCWGIIVICTIIMWFAAPSEAANKPLSSMEKITYRKQLRVYLALFGLVSILGLWSAAIPRSIACAWIIQIGMLFIPQFMTRTLS